MAHFLLIYDLVPDYLERREALREQHLGLAWQAADRGDLLLGGALVDPVDTAMLLFADADKARAFAEADPYVTQGLVAKWQVRPWYTVVGEGAAHPIRL